MHPLPPTVELALRGRGTRSFDIDVPVLASAGGTEEPRWVLPTQLTVGDFLGIQYGRVWPEQSASVPALPDRPLYGPEKPIVVPQQMTDDLAFLLGAYMSEGHWTRSNWSVVITNSVPRVLERAPTALLNAFGLRARIVYPATRCSYVVVASKRLVEFLDLLGCGSRASNKRVPDVVARSTENHVLLFLQGAALDAYTTHTHAAKWAICLESRVAIDHLQDRLSSLGILNPQIPKRNKLNGKTYYELYAAGAEGQKLCRAVPFLEPDKAASAAKYLEVLLREGSCADVVPGMRGIDLYNLIPAGRGGRHGRSTGRQRFRFLCDPRTKRVSRHSVERARAAGASIPGWLDSVLDERIHFVEVLSGGVYWAIADATVKKSVGSS